MAPDILNEPCHEKTNNVVSKQVRAVQAQKIARSWKFWIKKEEALLQYYSCNKSKGTDQLPS